MAEFLQVLFTGLSQGGIYALIGIGFSLVNMSTRVLNLAQGSYALLGGFVFLTLATRYGLPLWAALALVLVFVAMLGVVTERIVSLRVRPWRPISHDMAILTTLALVVVAEGAAFLIWGPDPQRGPALQRGVVNVLGAILIWQSVWMLVITLVIAAGLQWLLIRTWLGRSMRACAQNPLTAALLGIDVRRVGMAAFTLSAVIGALAGMLVSPITWLDYQIGGEFMLKGVLAYLLGGELAIAGPLVGGLVLGLVENLFLLFPGATGGLLKQVVPMALLIVMLVWRPQGLLGGPRAR